MKKLLMILAGALLGLSSLHAIPQSFGTINGQFFGPVIPATPRFNADLTEEFLSQETWQEGALSGDWASEPALDGNSIERMTANPVLFGSVPIAVRAYRESGELEELTITYLDSGLYFGFKMGGEQTYEDRRKGEKLRGEFAQHYNRLSRNLRARLEAGCGRGMLNVVGRSNTLRTAFTDYEWEDFVLRLATLRDQSITLTISRKGPSSNTFLDPSLASLSGFERIRELRENVTTNERGDLLVENVPMFSQGHTPFCSIHSLAMVGHYFGLRMKPDGLVASADFRNTGSAKGSKIMDVYEATAEEVQMRLEVTPYFAKQRVLESLEYGKPVIVWRRVTREREDAHNAFHEKLQDEPFATLPDPAEGEKETWPDREASGSPSHASVITGINLELNEVLFSEPWGDHARNRVMRIEEMEATTYAVFFFEF